MARKNSSRKEEMPSGGKSNLPSVDSFSLTGRPSDAIQRRVFERETTLAEVVKKGKLIKEGLAPRYSTIGCYYLCMPKLALEAYAMLRQQIEDYTSDRDNENPKWFYELHPELLLLEGADAFDVKKPSDALVQYFAAYRRDYMEYAAALLMCMVFVNVTGLNEFSGRLTSRIKPSMVRTVDSKVGPFPVNPKDIEYLINATRILRHDGPDDTLQVFLPIWMVEGQNWVEFPRRRHSFATVDVPSVDLSETYDHFGPVIPFPLLGNIPEAAYADLDVYQGLGSSYGYVADSLVSQLDYTSQRMITRYRDTLLAADSQLSRFFGSGGIGLLSGVTGYDELVAKVTANSVGSAMDFAKTHMKYHENPGPWPLRSHQQFNCGIQDPYLVEAGTPQAGGFTYSESPLLKTIASRAETYLDEAADGIKGVVAMGGFAALVTEDADELAKLREHMSAAIGASTVFITDWSYKDMSFDWSKWSFIGAGSNDGETASLLEGTLRSIESGWGSATLETGISPFDEATALVPDLFMAHVGDIPLVMNFLRMFSSSFTIYTGKLGQSKEDLLSKMGDRGNWMMNLEEIERGILRPYYLATPLVNQFDPMQCGFYVFLNQEDNVDDTGVRQPNRWAHWAKRGLREGTTLTPGQIVNVWSDDAQRAAIKDMPMFIGDALGLTPETHFSRVDISPFYFDATVALGVPYPIKPFVARRLSALRIPRSVIFINGIEYDYENHTPIVWPTDCVSIADEYSTGFTSLVNWKLLAWMFWLPFLTYDEDHPYPFGLEHYAEEAVRRADAVFNGGSFAAVIDQLSVTPIASTELDAAARRILKLEPKLDVKSLPTPFNRKEFNRPQRGQGERNYGKGWKSFGNKGPKPQGGSEKAGGSTAGFRGPKSGSPFTPGVDSAAGASDEREQGIANSLPVGDKNPRKMKKDRFSGSNPD